MRYMNMVNVYGNYKSCSTQRLFYLKRTFFFINIIFIKYLNDLIKKIILKIPDTMSIVCFKLQSRFKKYISYNLYKTAT